MNLLTKFLIGILVVLLFHLVKLIRKHLNYWCALGIPCEKPKLLMGNLAGVMRKLSFQDICLLYYNKFKGSGPFAGFYWFQHKAVFVLEPSLAKCILIKDFNKFTDRGFFTNEEDDPLSGHLFLLEGQKWRNMRNKLSPTFTSGKMKYMFPTVITVGDEFVQVVNKEIKQNAILEIRDLLSRFTMDVIGSCAFGIECNSLKNPSAEFRVMGRRVITDQRHGPIGFAFLNSFPQLARKLHMKQFPDAITDFFLGIVRETVAEREKHNIRRNDFMDMLIDLKNNKMIKSEHGEELTNLTLNEISAQAFVFLVAGFETSSTTMSFALYELAQNADIQQRAREEVENILESHNGVFNYECMKDMVYLDQIISETLRLYTIVPLLNRVCLEDYEVPGHSKYMIKKGMNVIIPAGAMHRDANLYDNPNVFNPENFSPEQVKERDSIEWLPFGDGPRNCIGMRFGLMQSRIGLALLLKNFKFSISSQTQVPMMYDKKQFLICPDGGVYLKVEKL